MGMGKLAKTDMFIAANGNAAARVPAYYNIDTLRVKMF